MKNRPIYKVRWKNSTTGRAKSYKVEVKRETLYCFACQKDKKVVRFPDESGYGSETTPQTACGACLNKRFGHKNEIALKQKRNRSDLTIEEQTFEHYGVACVHCGVSDIRLLKLYHHEGKDRQYRTEALGSKNRNHLRNYYFWLKTHNYPEQHKQIVMCLHCHVLHGKRDSTPTCKTGKKTKQVHKEKVKRVALTDRAKMLEMFGFTEADLKDND